MGRQSSERLRKQVAIDNLPGAYAMNAAVRTLPFDPAMTVAWLALLGNGPSVRVTHPSILVASVKDIIALGKAKPGYFTMASAGGYQHFVSELFRGMWGIDMAIVLYRGGYAARNGQPRKQRDRHHPKLPETQKRFTLEGAEAGYNPSTWADRIRKAELVKWPRVARDARMVSDK